MILVQGWGVRKEGGIKNPLLLKAAQCEEQHDVWMDKTSLYKLLLSFWKGMRWDKPKAVLQIYCGIGYINWPRGFDNVDDDGRSGEIVVSDSASLWYRISVIAVARPTRLVNVLLEKLYSKISRSVRDRTVGSGGRVTLSSFASRPIAPMNKSESYPYCNAAIQPPTTGYFSLLVHKYSH